jgi:hypothetical protein
MSSEGKRACAPAKRHLLVLLSNPQDKDWAKTCAEEIDDILKHTIIRDVLSCPCVECKEGRSRYASILGNNDISSWVGKMGKFKRLFATCIIADRPYLIYSFLQRDFDDGLSLIYIKGSSASNYIDIIRVGFAASKKNFQFLDIAV